MNCEQPTVEIVVHVYSEVIPDFARLFTAQLSSIALHPPERCQVRFTVCATPTDKLTIRTANAFDRLYTRERLPVTIVCRMYRKQWLFRRAIGRNDAALQTKADVVWFADADYGWFGGCLDALADLSRAGLPAALVHPREVNIHRSHELGDAELSRIQPGELFTPDFGLFIPRQEKFAIGGLQIVSGETARRFGYCAGTKWVRPVDEAGGFRDTKEDKVYRRGIEAVGGSAAVELPGLYRMRHSRSQWESQEKRLAQTRGVT